jgi:hypothetical protein
VRTARRSRALATALLAGTLVGAACTGDDGAPPAAEGSIRALKRGATELSLLQAQSSLIPGGALFTFGMATAQGELASGGNPQVWVATDENSRAIGPFPATYHEFSNEFGETSPRGAPGFYAAELDIPSTGQWAVAALVDDGSTRAAASGSVTVLSESVAQAGTEAMSVETPVARTEAGRELICSRNPPDPMHYISLDKALENGKPTVVNFGTPALCTSRICGPVVDEQLVVFNEIGREKANFIHVEIYPDQEAPTDPAPAFVAWGFPSEPWTLVIDGDGIIRAAFEGPVVAAQIRAALEPLL